MSRRVALVRTDISEELSASFIRLTRIGELGTTLAVTSNRSMPRRNISSQKTPFFIVTAMKTSNLTSGQESQMALDTKTYCLTDRPSVAMWLWVKPAVTHLICSLYSSGIVIGVSIIYILAISLLWNGNLPLHFYYPLPLPLWGFGLMRATSSKPFSARLQYWGLGR
jgi:hypothetical protein